VIRAAAPRFGKGDAGQARRADLLFLQDESYAFLRVAKMPCRAETGRPSMSHYLVRWQFKDATAKGLLNKPQDRTGPATELVEAFGGKLHCYYFAFGDYDGLGICEFPNNESVAAFSLKAAATGAFARFETTVLLTAQEAEAAMKHAHSAKVNYRPPGT
jgi:uncharacterized protein with GYD domain